MPVAPGVQPDQDGVTAATAGGTAAVSVDPAEGLTVAGPGGAEIGLAVAGQTESTGVVDSGNVVFTDTAPSTSIVARPISRGAQALIVIDGADAPAEFVFPVEVAGAAVQLRRLPDGEVAVVRAGQPTPVATIAPAWATDARGRQVPTHFELRGSSLVQVVEHRGASYPVVADPKYTWGYVSGTTFYNRKETRSLKTRSYAYVVAAGICAALGTASAGTACVAAGAFAAQWNYVAGNAYGDGKCVKIKVPTFWAYAYSGGYCK